MLGVIRDHGALIEFLNGFNPWDAQTIEVMSRHVLIMNGQATKITFLVVVPQAGSFRHRQSFQLDPETVFKTV